MPTIHIHILGDVQGVFFRATAKEIADKYSLTGWIKNTKEGDVEAVVDGDTRSLGKFIEWCKQGPEKANVTNVTVTNIPQTSFNGFSIIRH